MMKQAIRLFVLSCMLVAVSVIGARAEFPDRLIRLVVPFPPGGSTDVVARRVAAKASEIIGQPIVIENRGGAGGIIASEAVAKSPPDGYTILLTQTSHASNPALTKNLPYDTLKDFTPIAMLADHPGLFVVVPSLPVNSFKEFIQYTKENPGKVSYASAGNGTFPHLSGELLKKEAGISMVHVPYKGAGPAMTDLLGGFVQAKVDAWATAASLINDGKLKLLAITGTSRIPQRPDVPTIAESGYPNYDTSIWMGIAGPAGIPAEAVAKLEKAFMEACKDQGLAKRLDELGINVRPGSAKEFDGLIRHEIVKWREIVAAAGMKAD